MEPSVRHKKGDKSPTGDGRLFLQYKLGKEYWVTPEQFEKERLASSARCNKYHHSEKGIASRIAYERQPHIRAQRALIARTDPRYRASKLKFDRSDKGKLKKKAYYARPEVQARTRKRQNTYYHANKARHNTYQRRYLSKCINAAIAKRLRCLVRNTIVAFGGRKSDMTSELVGCSVQKFIKHMESQFVDGMTWQNIHIDHRVPCSAFDLTDPKQQRLCFNWRNCQPKFKRDNIAKSDKIEGSLLRGRELRNIIQFRKAS